MSAGQASWKAIGSYCLIAIAGMWLFSLPLWLGNGLESPYFMLCVSAAMWCPGLAAIVVLRFVERRPVVDSLGLKFGRSALPTLRYLGLALVSVAILCLLGLVTSALFGSYRFDIFGMSAFSQVLEQQLAAVGTEPETIGVPLRVLWLIQLISTCLIAPVINSFFALGEELGWRGYLYPRLAELTNPAIAVLLSGAIWGLWHHPIILLGYNYPSNPVLGVFAMMVPCIGLGAVLSWVTVRSQTIWPAALGHGAFNAMMGGFMLLFGTAGAEPDTLAATVMGWGGWPAVGLAVVVILFTGALRPLPGAWPFGDQLIRQDRAGDRITPAGGKDAEVSPSGPFYSGDIPTGPTPTDRGVAGSDN